MTQTYPATIVRTYKGSPTEAAAAFQADAARAAADGYYPINQVYTPGSWGCGAFLIALLLCIVVIGILVFIYMLIVKPAGTLTVTYQWYPPDQRPTAPPVVPGAIAPGAPGSWQVPSDDEARG